MKRYEFIRIGKNCGKPIFETNDYAQAMMLINKQRGKKSVYVFINNENKNYPKRFDVTFNFDRNCWQSF